MEDTTNNFKSNQDHYQTRNLNNRINFDIN